MTSAGYESHSGEVIVTDGAATVLDIQLNSLATGEYNSLHQPQCSTYSSTRSPLVSTTHFTSHGKQPVTAGDLYSLIVTETGARGLIFFFIIY